ncbi:MAG: MMPL family transporter [Spirochaetes bacterium]|nr:MMPL family transporter [Spirochaetota bacterium]
MSLSKQNRFRWFSILAIVLAAAGMSYLGTTRLALDMDITRSLPIDDPVIADAEYVMTHHPVKDRIVIDLGHDGADADLLVEGASVVERRLAGSGLFKSVGLEEYQSVFPELISYVMHNLPVLFSARELDKKIRPLLEPAKVREALADNYAQLLDLQGIGQANMMAADPLGFRNTVLARLAHLAPSLTIRMVRGHLVSSDGRHLLITAEPKDSATDTALARKIASLLSLCEGDLRKEFGPRGIAFTLNPVGAYRAALDNEETAKKDTRMAVIFATIGIAILLLLGFPRPFLGILALVPAVLGTIAAAFVYSLFSRSISILAIGFGGTIISFTVDYGIAYLLFLDRPYETRGMDATREVWGIGLLAMLTTAASFAFLFVSGFSALAQIGLFAALGVVFTYIFVHTLFPVIFPTMPPAKRGGFISLQKVVDLIMSSRPAWKAFAALAFGVVMLVFARPNFRVDLASMNTVSRDTLRAEKLVTDTWGNVLTRLYIMTEAGSIGELQQKGDRLAGELGREIASGALSSAFVPSMLFPGEARMKENLSAWSAFWTPKRVAVLRQTMRESSREIGFAPDAFDTFFNTIARRNFTSREVPEKFHGLLGIRRMPGGGSWAQFSVLTPGESYRAGRFYSRVSNSGLARLFDPSFFADRLGAIILSAFLRMTLIVGAITAAVAFVCLLDLRLMLISLAPTVFSLVCTLGAMKLLGEQPGIPTIIVAVIVIGMGTDYSMYLVRAYQRYMDGAHPSVGLIRLTVFLSACSTLIGFGVLSFAEHALLRSAGLTLALGIGFSFAGTILIVPPLLGIVFRRREEPGGAVVPGSKEHRARVERRYRFMEAYPRLFARYKMRYDPMFSELHEFLGRPDTIVDVGTGYGVPAAWVLEMLPGARLWGIEPDGRRRMAASLALKGRGTVAQGGAPELPEFPGRADAVLMIDMMHYLTDADLELLLGRARRKMSPKGVLIARATVPGRDRTILRMIEALWIRAKGLSMNYRGEEEIVRAMERAGFAVAVRESSNASREEKWFIGRPKPAPKRRVRSRAGR